jgi:hypothetical protein
MRPAWFARVGLPLAPFETTAIEALVAGVASHGVAIATLTTWRDAGQWLRLTEHDNAWWDDEEEERESLWARAALQRTESELLHVLEGMTRGLPAAIRVAALASATIEGVPDVALADAATAMAVLAAHQCALAQVAGAAPEHRFVRKFALFENGRWPLGYHSARFAIF